MFLLLATLALAGQTTFAQLSAAAASAREANDLPRAVTLYQQALELNPQSPEAWWSLGSVLYDLNRYSEAIAALQKFTKLNPSDPAGSGLLGLCEFETADYPASLKDISHSLEIGLTGQDQMEGVLRYHEALLLAHRAEFDAALRKYGWFVAKGVHHSVMLTALGLAALHDPRFPDAVPTEQRAVFLAAGDASYLSMTGTPGALDAFRALAEKYPSTPFVHFVYGQLLLPTDPIAAIAEMRRELQSNPKSGEVCATLSWLLMENDNFQDAIPLAGQAFHLAPDFPMSSYVFGRALTQKGNLNEGIQHLEVAIKNAPTNLISHIALAAAYARAGRSTDARRERAIAMQLAHEQ